MEVFGKWFYDEVCIDEIVECVGVLWVLMYYYFLDKWVFFVVVVKDEVDWLYVVINKVFVFGMMMFEEI